jgi:hypothetical protein
VLSCAPGWAAARLSGAKGRARERANEARERAAKRRAEAKERAAERREEAKERAAEKREEAKARAAEKREEAKERAAEKREEAKERAAEAREKAEGRAAERRENQEKRIAHGVEKGYLTDEELADLRGQQQELADLEESITGDGQVSREEAQDLRQAFNEASRGIWGEKHDTDGEQMATYRYGENVYAKSDLTGKMTSGDLTAEEAKEIAGDMRRLTELKRTLSASDLDEDEVEDLQEEYNDLLNEYFEVR